MSGITWIHIAAGMLALLAGAVAFSVRKGGGMHVSAGIGFCVAMFVLGVTASILSPLKSPPESPIGGIMVCYFVATAWMTARRRSGIAGRFEKFACAGMLVVSLLIIIRAFEVALAPTGRFPGPPGPIGLFLLGSICLLAALGDLRFIVRVRLTATQRISRHLWRMSFAFFIATGSFFLGQQDVLPQAVRGSPILLLPAFAPFALMLFWLLWIRVPGTRSLKPQPSLPAED